MKKYWHVLNIGIQNTLVYRFNFLFRSLFSLAPLVASVSLWQTIYGGRGPEGDLAGYSLSRMISYYIVAMVIDALTAVTDDDWQVAEDIREGQINHFLLKPIDYLGYRLCLFGAGRLVYSLVAFLPMLVVILALHDDFYWPKSFWTFPLFLGSLVLTGLLQFFISYTVALLAFWVLEVSTWILMLFALEYVAGGHLFPLDILPPFFQQALSFTPFPYEIFFPASIYLEQLTPEALGKGMALQIIWVLAIYQLARWVWQRGLKRYSAVGG
jgi:ABC-2 type transport system permease protein